MEKKMEVRKVGVRVDVDATRHLYADIQIKKEIEGGEKC